MTCAPSNFMPERNKGGRPREHDREQIMIDLIEWARKPDSINLCKFCCTREPPLNPRKLSEWSKECNKFRETYETAKAFLGARREEWLNQEHLHVKAYDLNATTYDIFLKEEKQDQQKYESLLKADEAKSVDASFSDKFDKFNKAIDQARESSKALKSSEINSSAEAKS
jgi:hypothetical protein